MLELGQKVTMTADFKWDSMKPGEIAPQFGLEYRIRSIVESHTGARMRFAGFRFYEIVNPVIDGLECSFESSAFRPVDHPAQVIKFPPPLPREVFA